MSILVDRDTRLNSSIVGIGGDPVPGSSFVDVIELFESDPETELSVTCGEIGGSAEEIAEELLVGASRPNSRDEWSPSGRPNQGTRV